MLKELNLHFGKECGERVPPLVATQGISDGNLQVTPRSPLVILFAFGIVPENEL